MRCSSSSSSDEWEITAPARTVVLVGKTGNGKSATGNTLIGRKVFDSKPSLGGVTSSCQLDTAVLDDGRILNVIDTPGLFDSSVEGHAMATEIARCINMAKDGIHAILLVVSLRNRFSEEEASAFERLIEIFGGKIADYMIVVFSHGDVLDEDTSLDQLLGADCPQPLMSTLKMCGNRMAVVDNKRGDKFEMRNEIVSLVDYVVDNNGGKPYTNELFDEVKKREKISPVDQASEANSAEWKFPGPNDEQFERFVQMVETRLKESIRNLERQLAAAEIKVWAAEVRREAEVEEMRERLAKAEEMCKPGNVNLEKQLAEAEAKVDEMRERLERAEERCKPGNMVSEMMNNMINDLKKNIRELREKILQRQRDGNCVIM